MVNFLPFIITRKKTNYKDDVISKAPSNFTQIVVGNQRKLDV